MLQTVKLMVYQAAKAVGGFAAVANSNWRRSRLVILCYHGVSIDDEHQWNPGLYITPGFLRRRLQILRDTGYNILPLGEAIESLGAGMLPARSIVLTFDDGCFDFYEKAMPVLREFKVPVTNYVATYYSFFERPVFDPMLSYLLWKGAGKMLRWPEVVGDSPMVLTPENHARTCDIISKVVFDRDYSGQQKDEFLAELASRLGIDYKDLCERRILQLMNPDELRSLLKEGVDVQLHTHRHRMPRQAELFVKEIEDNRLALDVDGSRKEVLRHFCYPSGVYYRESGGLLKQCGVVSATTCDPGLASSESDLQYLPRFCDSTNVPEIVFEGWLSGIARILPHKEYKFGE